LKSTSFTPCSLIIALTSAAVFWLSAMVVEKLES
jgi:hypothetical protein